MKTFTSSLKMISIMLSTLILLQSCVVYNKTPVNLDQAVEATKEKKNFSKSKIFYKDGNTQECFKVVKEQNNYYCVNKKDKIFEINYTRDLINKERVEFVKTQNKTKSITKSIIVPVLGTVVVIAAAIGIILFSISGTFPIT
ncbi:hypothetical protein [Aestuariivivens marinum]|uniref:hypothetical protein n=1 Tax=Aestuariivivens marinum TaxID=2913555 RepID=UPI001F571756|nr:hypothetical protein [Aestuariivivens marinum]